MSKSSNDSRKSQVKNKEYTIEIPDVHPSLNTWTRMHFRERNKLKQQWHNMVSVCVMKANIPFIKKPVAVWIENFHNLKTVDLDNYTPKFIMDPLRDIVLADDNVKFVKDLRITFEKCSKKERRTIVHLTEMD